MFAGLQGWQLVIIIALVVLLFAAPKLPAMARNLGQSMRIFKSEVKQMKDEGANAQGTPRDGSGAVEGRVVDDAADTPRKGRTTGTTDQQ
ncbi:Sec-independent protein translocase subunit TatA [Citricoccus sp. SGAir0253]|uniref:Sec-independent protein translocase subunit TatA n=1 Tax=Citricoccus sp. SGAir0253 TaxID=2567881 RepID=UPI0010CCEA26|nr:Sec-independent protein translocase subunit TatA [Citricoccus sp. SGAir0253]QCU78057.1 Sec-independent protein translocase subunit TatA [Citricoccus sp. SGAir0253]